MRAPTSTARGGFKPVVTSNTGSMWKLMRLAGDKRAVPGAGRLFREH